MLRLKHLSIKSKLTIMLLIASVGSILVVSYLSWSKSREILTERIFSQLTSVRASKAYQIEFYLNYVVNQVETLCENLMVVEAMTAFNQEFDRIQQSTIPPNWDQAIETYYTDEFLPRLEENTEGTPVFETYRPTDLESRYLQYHYIANNPNPVGQKDELSRANDGSAYSQIHNRYHRLFQNFIQRFGYYDLFLIDSETGHIVYSVYKETDYATSLYTGPYRNSNLADVVRQVRDNPDVGAIQLVDFQFYRPSYNAPAAFLAGPIYDGNRLVGILAAQLPIDEIDRVLTGNQNWEQDGLGETGETYLVGDDLRLRSAARLLIESPDEYLEVLRESRIDPETVDLIEQLQTSVLLHPIETDAAQNAVDGEAGTQIISGYYRSEVLSSYAPLNIQGVNWAIVSEISLAEAYAPINVLQTYLFLSLIVLILLVTLFATIVAQRFTRPIDLMVDYSRNMDSVEALPELDITEQNEFSDLAQIVNRMTQQIRQKTAAIAQKEQEKETLLLNILPRPVMERWQQGETRIRDQAQQVTIISIQILGLEEAQATVGHVKAADALNEWVTLLDEKGNLQDVERLNCFGDRYVAACGLAQPRLDHVKRSVDFAQESLNLLKTINQKYRLDLSVQIGIHTGAVTAALIGQSKFQYDIWGEPVRIANQLAQSTSPNTIRITQAVYERVQNFVQCEPSQSIPMEDSQSMPTWSLGKSSMGELIDQLTTGLGWDDDSPDPDRTDDSKRSEDNWL